MANYRYFKVNRDEFRGDDCFFIWRVDTNNPKAIAEYYSSSNRVWIKSDYGIKTRTFTFGEYKEMNAGEVFAVLL